MNIRRVVTAHDGDGKAVAHIWSPEGFPADNAGATDRPKEITATTRDNGTVFRVIEYGPGVTPRNHRTNSIDYAVVLSGEIDMELDDQLVTLRAGDVLVQRGTIHNWVNRYDAPCVIAFVLIDAHPVEHDGRPLKAHG